MTISIQLVEVPENEQVQARQVAFPSSGGTIGRAFDCTLVLPDFNRILSRVHAEILPKIDGSGGFELMNRSANGLQVNAQPLMKSKTISLFDGDVIKLGGYVLLVSDLNSALSKTAPVTESIPENNFRAEASPFNNNLVDQDDFMSPFGQEDRAFTPPPEVDDVPVSEYSVDNVQSEDPFGSDPFAEDDVTFNEPKKEIPVLEVQALEVDTAKAPAEQQLFQDNLKMLTKLVEQQQPARRDPLARDKLMTCLESTLDRFLETLAPQNLEEEFNDYLSGWGSKDKKYWHLYKKQFERKLKQGEFQRQFSAMFLEEMREKDQ